jgi:hypothetical protein
MSTSNVYRSNAERCLRIARMDGDADHKPFWLTLAQSWLRLAEHSARAPTRSAADPGRQPGSPPHRPGATSPPDPRM